MRRGTASSLERPMVSEEIGEEPAYFGEGGLPGRAMMGAGVDEDAVHVEDDGFNHSHTT